MGTSEYMWVKIVPIKIVLSEYLLRPRHRTPPVIPLASSTVVRCWENISDQHNQNLKPPESNQSYALRWTSPSPWDSSQVAACVALRIQGQVVRRVRGQSLMMPQYQNQRFKVSIPWESPDSVTCPGFSSDILLCGNQNVRSKWQNDVLTKNLLL